MFGIGNQSESVYLGSKEQQSREESERKAREEEKQTIINLQISIKQKNRLKELAKRSGLSLSAYIRNTFFGD